MIYNKKKRKQRLVFWICNKNSILEIVPQQYQPIEFVVSGGNVTGYNNTIDQYSTDTGGYTTTTTTTTTKRKITSGDTGGYNEITNNFTSAAYLNNDAWFSIYLIKHVGELYREIVFEEIILE